MKKLFCLLLVCLLLFCGCAKNETQEPLFLATHPTLAETEPTDPEEVLAYRRDVAEAMMRHMNTVLWTLEEDVTYSYTNNSQGIEADTETTPNHIVHLKAGRIYRGIPYAHGCAPAYSFLAYTKEIDENGVHTLSGFDHNSISGSSTTKPFNLARIGNDCADQVFWSWAQISGSISFAGTKYMTEDHGCLKVGDYDFEGSMYSFSTKDTCKQNGEQRMFEAYAQMQKADALVQCPSSSGHAIMNVRVNVVRNADGTIDGEKSYAVILEQDAACEVKEKFYYDEQLQQNVYICEEIDKELSFNALFKRGYLPVTCKELVDPTPNAPAAVEDPETDHTSRNLFTSVIKANYRIASVTLTISDTKGNLLQKSTCFNTQSEFYTFSLYRFLDPAEQPVLLGTLDLNALEEGTTYHYTYTCKLSTGDEIVFRDFKAPW